MHKVVDCFPYFNEREILELRVRLLENYVDKFIIVDANYTHSGEPKEYTLRKTIDELDLPRDKIEIIELDLSEEKLPPVTEYELHWGVEKVHSSRERLQRDAIAKCLESNDFDDETIFIIGDCDEIINPKYIELHRECALNNPDKIFKLDLVQLEGRADMRAYYTYNPNIPREWCYSLFVCLKSHMKTTSLTHIRANIYNPYPIVWAHENGQRMSDLGWHFSWMGDNLNRLKKSQSFCHHDQDLDFLKYNNYSNGQMKEFLLDYEMYEGQISPGGDTNFILKRYPIENLPRIIFELPNVKQFLLS